MKGSVLDAPHPTPPIDHRLRARRIQVRRHEGRRRLRRLILALVVSLAALAAWGATRSPLLDVDHLVVEGTRHTAVDAVVAATGISTGDPLVDVDLGVATTRVGALPWIAEASVTRTLGGRIEVHVVERTAALVVGDAGGIEWLVDSEGWVLDEADDALASPAMLRVEGIDPTPPGSRLEPVPESLLSVVAQVPRVVRELTDAVEVDDRGEIWFRLRARPGEVDAEGAARTDGGRVRLGDARAVEAQLLAAATVLTQVDLTDLEVLDVRATSNPVVTRVALAGEDGA